MSFPPTLKQLRYLVALHRVLHFGKAAEACHVTQSTLSAGLQELEGLLGLRLVERTKRSVMFTPDGEAVVARAVKILADVDDLTSMAAAARNPLAGVVRLGVIPTIAPFLLPKVMPALKAALPDLELHLREDKSATLCELLKDGELDVVLYALPFACGEVTEEPLFEDPFMVAFPRGEAPDVPVTANMLKDTRLMLLEEGHCLRDHALAACKLVGPVVKQALAGTSLHTMVQMVAAGYGVTLLPQMAIDAGLTDESAIDLVPLADINPARTIGMIWRPSNPRSETFRTLGQIIRETCAQ